MINSISAFFLASSLTTFLLGVWVVTVNFKNKIYQSWCVFCASVALWSMGLGLLTSAKSNALANVFYFLHYFGAIFIPVAFLYFVQIYFFNNSRFGKAMKIGVILAFFQIGLFLTGRLVSPLTPKWKFNYYTNPGQYYWLFMAYFFVYVLYGFFLMFSDFKRTPREERRKKFFLILATGIGYMAGSSAFLLVYFDNIPPYGIYVFLLFPLLITYGIVRHRLLDIQIAVTRTGIFVFIYCIVIGIPAYLIFQLRGFLESQWGNQWWLLPAGVFSLLSFGGPFIYLVLQRKAEALLLKEQLRYQQTLLQASRGMTLIKDLDRLLKLIVHILTKTIRITHARIFLWDNNTKQFISRAVRGRQSQKGMDVLVDSCALTQYLKEVKTSLVFEEICSRGAAAQNISREVVTEMEKLEGAVIIPSFLQDRLLGIVVLGNKRSKKAYTESDLDILSTLANQAALAIENCVFLTEFEQQQAHFFQAAKMADLGTMASGIGHQVNNRFHVIRLGAESALMMEVKKLENYFGANGTEKEKKMVASLSETCQRIANNAAHGGDIVRRLLDFSRLSVGFKLMDVKEAIESSVRLWECKHDLRTIGFHTEIAPDLRKINGNFSEVEEVLFNLLDNAADAIRMKEEAFKLGSLPKPADYQKGTIWLRACNESLNGKPHVLITVREDGIGMDEETQKRIFVPFFTTKATAIKGTGLGLYIMRRMVDAHHGSIKIESEYGQGTTFYIYLPAAVTGG